MVQVVEGITEVLEMSSPDMPVKALKDTFRLAMRLWMMPPPPPVNWLLVMTSLSAPALPSPPMT